MRRLSTCRRLLNTSFLSGKSQNGARERHRRAVQFLGYDPRQDSASIKYPKAALGSSDSQHVTFSKHQKVAQGAYEREDVAPTSTVDERCRIACPATGDETKQLMRLVNIRMTHLIARSTSPSQLFRLLWTNRDLMIAQNTAAALHRYAILKRGALEKRTRRGMNCPESQVGFMSPKVAVVPHTHSTLGKAAQTHDCESLLFEFLCESLSKNVRKLSARHLPMAIWAIAKLRMLAPANPLDDVSASRTIRDLIKKELLDHFLERVVAVSQDMSATGVSMCCWGVVELLGKPPGTGRSRQSAARPHEKVEISRTKLPSPRETRCSPTRICHEPEIADGLSCSTACSRAEDPFETGGRKSSSKRRDFESALNVLATRLATLVSESGKGALPGHSCCFD